MKLIVRQTNGLGNQLFRYAAARYFSEKSGASILMTIHHDLREQYREKDRPFLLDKFNISATTRYATRFDRFLQSEKPLIQPLAALTRTLGRVALLDEPEWFHFSDLPTWDHRPRVVYMRGFWQAARYAEANAAALRRELTLKAPPTPANAKILDEIMRSPNAISVHVRRSDYLQTQTPMSALAVDYYRKAIGRARSQIENPLFFVFSDDVAYARLIFDELELFRFVDCNNHDTSYEDLRLMSACRHHIIANSSFSWWGAWLGQNSNKLVIAPQHWMGPDSPHFPDVCPRSWTLLS